MTDKIILADLRSVKFCFRGTKAFGAKLPEYFGDLTWDEFVRNGIDLAVVEKIDDAMAQKVVAVAKERIAQTQAEETLRGV